MKCSAEFCDKEALVGEWTFKGLEHCSRLHQSRARSYDLMVTITEHKGPECICYWYSKYEPHFPDPTTLVDRTIPQEKRDAIVAWLKGGSHLCNYLGSSGCRCCGETLGCADMTHDGWIYPSLCWHYVEKHEVWIPQFDRILSGWRPYQYYRYREGQVNTPSDFGFK